MTDKLRVRQILINLLQNAIKFTDVGSVALRCELAEGGVMFKVVDTGPGMAPEAAARLFDSDQQYQSNAAQREHGGTGLGLALVSSIVGRLGGSIRAKSAAGDGMTMTVFLPAATLPRKEHNVLRPDGSNRSVVVYPTPKHADPMTTPGVLLRILADLAVDVVRPANAAELEALSCLPSRDYTAVFLLNPGIDHDDVAQAWVARFPHKDRVHELYRTPVFASAVRALVLPTTISEALPSPKHPPPPRSILAAEDDSTIRNVLLKQLAHCGDHKCLAVANGLLAVEAYEHDPEGYDVVLLDVNMPVMDGPTAAQRIRDFEKSQGLRRVRIIAVSGHDEEETELLFGALVDLSIEKPLTKEKLRMILSESKT